ncbi:fimbrial protein [Pseudomonas sp. A34-9]|uniref:fimbrial protein n=1 Tax=Pseudomonas sp. A34-9 TaxID=3034675 RepID=UPI00240CFD1D|nr:fimbrial protein [Pseudomonas sp. A34-9]
MKVKYIGLLVVLLSWSINAAATCTFDTYKQQSPMNYQIPSNLTIPRDALNGTVIFQGEFTVGITDSWFSCTTSFSAAIKNNVGTSTPESELFPIGATGIAWKLYYSSTGKSLRGYLDPNNMFSRGSYGFSGTRFRLELVKVGDVKGGTVIPSGVLGYLQTGDLFPLSIQTNGATVITASCETPNIDLRMGTYTLSDIGSAPGSTAAPVAFGINLNNCPKGINTVNYSFQRVGETYDYRNGVIRLNSSSTAKGVGIQIKHFDNAPAIIDGTSKRSIGLFGSGGASYTIPMNAAYYRIQNEELKPGTANAELNFTIEYL